MTKSEVVNEISKKIAQYIFLETRKTLYLQPEIENKDCTTIK